MNISQIFALFALFLNYSRAPLTIPVNYLDYHRAIIHCETQIADQQFGPAIQSLDSIFQSYEFVFLRDCRLAVQLCAQKEDAEKGFRFLYRGIQQGWSLKSMEKDARLAFFQKKPAWEQLRLDYDSLHQIFLSKINLSLREEVQRLLKKDQKKALAALLRIGQKAKKKYNEKKFAPHSEAQLAQLDHILDTFGYPGEKLIGNNWWASVILSHHNSISSDYNSRDTLFHYLKPKLLRALSLGQISPDHLASIQDWRSATVSSQGLTSYGFLGKIPDKAHLKQLNSKRAEIGLRSTILRNRLIDIETLTGMNLYLPKDWQQGKIEVEP